MKACRLSSAASILVLVVATLGAARSAEAQFILIAPGGPSGYSAETVYGPPFGPPPAGPGAAPVLLPPPPPNPPAPPGTYIVDALSSGNEAGDRYLFSVTAGAVGLPATPVAFEVAVGTPPSQIFPGPPIGPFPPEPEGDVFQIMGPTFGIVAMSLAPVMFAAPIDEFLLGLNVGPAGPPVGDDLNGLMIRMPAGGVGTAYYSLAAGGLGPIGPCGPMPCYQPADIISPALPLGVPWAPAVGLGLDSLGPGSDDIDALIIQDLGLPGAFDPADFVAFSLTPGSATLGIAGPGYAAGGGDLLVPDGPDPDPLPDIFIPAIAFGLVPAMDNLDAIDTFRPPPAAPALQGWGMALLMAILLATALPAARRLGVTRARG